MGNTSTFEEDPWLVKEKLHMEWAIRQMRGLDAGELCIFVFLTIRDRWLECGKWTYGYELAWVFQRDRGTIGHVLDYLFDEGRIQTFVEWSPGSKRRRKWVRPTEREITRYLDSINFTSKEKDDDWWADRHEEECECNRFQRTLAVASKS